MFRRICPLSHPGGRAGILVVACLTILCACKFEKGSTGPIGPTPDGSGTGFAGVWSAASTSTIGVPAADSCTNAHWNVTSISNTTVSGDFSATCAGGFTAAGTGTGIITTTGLDWQATGTATQGNLTCPFSLNGTATLESTGVIRIAYAGTVCGNPVQGTELLHRQ